MLYIIIGKDRQKTKAKLDELNNSLVKKSKSYPVEQVMIEAESLLGGAVEQYLYNLGLFGEQYIVHCSDLLKDKAVADLLKGQFGAMAESPNFFIIREEDIDAATRKILVKIAEEIFEIEKPSVAKSWGGGSGGVGTGDFNIFTMTDALGDRDRKKAWLIYVEARRIGNEPEQIFGTIWWFVKNMMLVGASGAGGLTGLSPFVESKAKRALKNYSQGEVLKMSKYLVSVYHESRRGKCDLTIELEKFVLGKY